MKSKADQLFAANNLGSRSGWHVVTVLSDGEEIMSIKVLCTTEHARLLKQFGQSCSLQVAKEITKHEPV